MLLFYFLSPVHIAQMDKDKMWMNLPWWHHEYVKGVNNFIEWAFCNKNQGDQLCCPCRKCVFLRHHTKSVVKDHLIAACFVDSYDKWIFHGKENDFGTQNQADRVLRQDDMDGLLQDVYRGVEDDMADPYENREGLSVEAKTFFKLVEEGQEELYPGCEKFSKLSFTIHLHNHKCVHGISNEAFDELMKLLKEAFPHAKFPNSFNEAKKVMKDLGLDYKKIHACPNNCMLY